MIVFDSSIYIDDLRSGRFSERIAGIGDLIRNSSVVLAELWRGATTAAEEKFLVWLASHYPVLTPTENIWIESGQILRRVQEDYGFEAAKLRDLHFDVLIALTARAHGARLITSNRADFELIREYREFRLEVW
jgi:predicted nucleic acid-binding protein